MQHTTVQLPTFVITRTQRDRICEHVLAQYPNEACGLIIGKWCAARCEVKEILPTQNVWQSGANDANDQHSQRDRYMIDPTVIAQADRAASAQGYDIVGVFHSHPNHLSQPSSTDLETAWGNMIYVITAIYNGQITKTQAWQLNATENGFDEVTIVCE
jgi:proteasome lid subunit RPN8/RPN11